MKPNRPNRQPAHLEYIGGKSPRQRMWELIRSYQAPFTLADLAGRLPARIHYDTTRTYLKSLVASGHVVRQPGIGKEPTTYRLVRDNGVEAPRVRRNGEPVQMGRAQENLWRTLRAINRPFKVAELAALAATPVSPVSLVAALDYLRRLHAAGYFKVHTPPTGEAIYRLILDTGPRPPMVQRVHRVYDQNLGQIMWTEPSVGEDGHE